MTRPDAGPPRAPSICPHCWAVNPAMFRLCGRCGAQMDTLLQESGGLRRTSPIQSPVPVTGARLGPAARFVLAVFVAVLALGYLVHLLPLPRDARSRLVPPSEGNRQPAPAALQ